MAQIDDFFMYENRVEGITDADYQRAQPYVEWRRHRLSRMLSCQLKL